MWFIAFSHNGKYLASASKDSTAIIWALPDTPDGKITVLHILMGHTHAISYLSWSMDDQWLLSCGNMSQLKLWEVKTGACKQTIVKHSEAVMACGWLPDSQHFISGGADKNLYMWDLSGKLIKSWTCARVNDLAITSDGKYLIVICQERKIRFYNLLEDSKEDFIQETDAMTSLCISKDNKQLLVNVSSRQEIHGWDVISRKLVNKYSGQKQGRFVIRSGYGGANQNFVISGSEDSQVYVWHRNNENLLEILSGHSGCVNSVAWNPKNPYMFASASDDHTIRIWQI